MPAANKPEVFLEITSGSFRIATTDVIYHITVVAEQESSATRVVERILAAEPPAAPPPVPPPPPPAPAPEPEPTGFAEESYYKDISTDLYRDIGGLARKLSSTLMTIPAEDRRLKRAQLDEAGDKLETAKSQLKDIVEMTERATMEIMDSVEKIQRETIAARDLLSHLKDHHAFRDQELPEGELYAVAPVPSSLGTELAELRGLAQEARGIIASLRTPGEPAAPMPAADRLDFQLDVIFQTLYEFCTNEGVKKHLSTARQKAAEIFVTETFQGGMNAVAAGMAPDGDNFLNIPLDSLLDVLAEACQAEAFRKLVGKMKENRASIFLDSTLPIEMPPLVPAAGQMAAAAEEGIQASDSRLQDLDDLLGRSLKRLAGMIDREAVGSESAPATFAYAPMTREARDEILDKVGAAFGMVAGISEDVARILETLSFQDLSGQQIMKIIKLLTDFEVQLLAIVVSFGSQLKNREQNRGLTVEESKALAQKDVDDLMGGLSGEAVGEKGILDQDTVNRMLAGMGF
ncbi:MAG: protein phosphatase CheZ [Thermodesulfobacteriota bacterium]